jgi:cell division transport system permease protein
MSINVGYFFRESIQNFRRNWVMSIGAVVTIFLSLLLVGISMSFGYIASGIVQSVESKVTIQIFLKDGAPVADVDALQSTLVNDAAVKGVDYVSKDEALEKFKKDMAESPEIVANIRGNPLPASLDVTLKDPREVEVMVVKIKANPQFTRVADRPSNPEESLRYGQQVVKKLFAVTRIIRYVLIGFVLVLAIVSLIFINNTIRLAIYARRKEIGIMRLVGASNWFIRTPFLMEGILQSLIGAALAIALIAATTSWILPQVREAIPFLPLMLTSADMAQISLVLVLLGMFIGLIGSGFALRRYLKV